VVASAEDGGELVHQPTVDAGRHPLGRLGDERQVEAREPDPAEVGEPHDERGGQRGAGREARSGRHGRGDVDVDSVEMATALTDRRHARGDEPSPVRFDDVERAVGIDVDEARALPRPRDQTAVVPMLDGHDALAVDRKREDQTVVVVGVVAHQVDAPRCAKRASGHGADPRKANVTQAPIARDRPGFVR
jgi:hypothetical protein